MTIENWVKQSTDKLESASIGTARLDSLVLLEDELGKERAWILAHPEHGLSQTQIAKLTKLLNRRAKHEPLAYIRGHTEFYGRDFVITPDVLVPRPESEAIIDLLGELSASGDLYREVAKNGTRKNSGINIADVGTGSGALGITAKLEFPPSQKVTVDLLEIDPEAAKIAKINVDKYTTGINVIVGDLLGASTKNYDVLLCNLPYVPDDYVINQAAGFEPSLALYGGTDGLDLYRRLSKQLKELEYLPLYLLLESLPVQHAVLEQIFRNAGYKLLKSSAFVQLFATTS